MSDAALWLVGGLVVCALEMVVPGVFLLWIGLAALATGALTAAIGLGWHGQLGGFAVLAVLLVGAVAMRRRTPPDTLNAPGAGLIGQTCHAIGFSGGEGRVTLGDGTWPARAADGSTPHAGQALRVVGLEGTTLVVERRG